MRGKECVNKCNHTDIYESTLRGPLACRDGAIWHGKAVDVDGSLIAAHMYHETVLRLMRRIVAACQEEWVVYSYSLSSRAPRTINACMQPVNRKILARRHDKAK